MWKNSHVVMLSTQSKAVRLGQLVIGAGNNLFSSRKSNNIGSLTAYELYITSDEEIKVDDYVNDILALKTHIADEGIVSISKHNNRFKKIIATTDTSLKLYDSEVLVSASGFSMNTDDINLPQLSKHFIEKYIEEHNKGNVITKVMVEYVQVPNSVFIQVLEAPYIQLKINSDNTINLKPIKDSWNREEHIANIKAFAKEFVANTDTAYKQADIDKWIKNNL